jgi:multimeric flavodoxin WrbA
VSEQPPIRIIGLNGSPHKNGNTATLMKWVLEGCAEAGAEVEWIHVAERDIGYCQGCHTCMREGFCPIQDDVPAIRDKLLAADGIVVGSPVYEGQTTAQLKTLQDRLTLFILYTDLFSRQRTVGVATSGIAPTKGTAKKAAEFSRCSGIIGAQTASFTKGYRPLAEAHSPRLPRRARALGRKLVRDIRNAKAFDLKRAWIGFLRFLLNTFLVSRYPDQFAGAIRMQREKRWPRET